MATPTTRLDAQSVGHDRGVAETMISQGEGLPGLHAQSTLADLPAHELRVSPDTKGQRVGIEFESHPELPGVLIVDGRKLLGMISRESFREHMSRPFALELYLLRPISVLLEAIQDDPLLLPATCGIHEAAHVALTRPRKQVYEPVIVDFGGQGVRLLGFYTLLVAQSQLLALANATINEQKTAADAANLAKSQFLANMSHEIRTPMNGVLGMTDLVLQTQLTGEQREYLQMVKDSAEWLLTVINDVLDFSKIEAGKLDLEHVPFRLRATLDGALKPLAFRARARSLELVWRVADELPEVIVGDSVRVRQILVNLIGNAIKFTERGRITVEVAWKQWTEEGVELQFSVSDTGIGIPADRLHSIFAAFEQADGSTTRRYGGTGLGLSISSRLVELMEGQIWVESQPGHGSTFHFTANFGLAEEETLDVQAEPVRQIEFEPLRILVAEDNPVNQRLIHVLLQQRAHEVTLVGDGKSALAALEQQPFDLVLMDVQMPIMDGLEATRAIRQRERGRGVRVPIIAMTAHAMQGDRQRCLDAGMDGYVSKPIAVDDLLQAMATCVSPTAPRAVAPALIAPVGSSVTTSAAIPHGLVDWDAACEKLGGDQQLLRIVVEEFLANQVAMIDEAQQALVAQDATRLRRAAHSIKGAVGYFCAPAAYEAAFQLETLGQEGNLADAADHFATLSQELIRLTPELEAYME